jgi:hypothetical protein
MIALNVRFILLTMSVNMGVELACVAGHAAMTFPKPRNAYDGELAPWTNWAYPCDATHKGDNCTITGVVGVSSKHYAQIAGACPISAHNPKVRGALNANNGQSCYWFNNGCTVGCNQWCVLFFSLHTSALQHMLSSRMDLADPLYPSPLPPLPPPLSLSPSATDSKWKKWEDTIEHHEILDTAKYSDITVQTVYTAQFDYMLDLLLTHQKKVR